eukprot:TRINITY_DN6355_c0_g1_i1.p2 TRINITY_DN6355_c0_g1~~TRINITY_DN6355_c0_g1_i1.p2  ORF type:complete len:357 (+),score=106.39 TRINITY_DN6355_c0_g1_i1:1656-2726(+)
MFRTTTWGNTCPTRIQHRHSIVVTGLFESMEAKQSKKSKKNKKKAQPEVDQSEEKRMIEEESDQKEVVEESPQPEGKKKKNKKKKSKQKAAVGTFKDAYNLRENMTDEQIAILDQFKSIMEKEDLTPKEREWCSEMCLCRYLRARDYDIEKSHPMLMNTLKWRREVKPRSITAEDVKIELQNEGKMYRNGKDKFGRPIIYMKPRFDNTGAEQKEVKVKYLVYLLEKAILSMDESKGVEKLALYIDWKDYSQLGGMSQMSISKEIAGILQDHYPERLGVAFMLNAPFMFKVFWKFISAFLAESTKQKVVMMGSDMEPLQETVDLDVLEEEFGGHSKFRYNFEEQWQKLDQEFPPEKD